MKLFLKVLAGLIVLVVVAVGIFIATFDVNQYKGQIISLVQEKTGREFDVAGEFKLGVSLIPTIKVDQVRLGNAAWGSAPDMIKVKTFELELGLIPLLSGDLKVNQLTLDTAEILLETNKEGVGNWVFTATGEKPAEAQPDAAPEKSAAGKVNVNEINIQNSKLTYKDGKTGKTTQVSIEEFVVEGGTFSTSLDIVLKAVYNQVPVSVDGSIGSLANLTENEKFPLDISASVGEAIMDIEGSVAEPRAFKGLDLELEFKAPTLQPFAKILEKELPDIGAIEVTGQIAEAKDIYTFRNLSVQALSSNISIDGQVSGKTPNQNFDIQLKLDTDTLANFNRAKDLTGREFPDMGPVHIKGRVSEKDGFYILDNLNANLAKDVVLLNGKVSAENPAQGFDLVLKLNSENLSKFNALAGQELPSAGPLTVEGNVSEQNGVYLFKDVRAVLPNSRLTVDGKLTDVTKTDGSDLKINFESTSLADLNGLVGSDLPALGPVALVANVSDQKGTYNLKNMTFKLDKTDLVGDMVINIKGERPAVTATLNSSLIDVTPFQPEKKEEAKPEKTAKDAKVFSSEPLPFETLKTADANLDINAKKIKTRDMDLDNVKLQMSLNNGNLRISNLTTNIGGGSLSMNMALDASSGKSGTLDTKLDVKNLPLSTLPDLKDKITGANTDLKIEAKGSGSNIAQIMAGLNGKFLMTHGPGDIKSDDFGIFDAEILATTLNIFDPSSGQKEGRKLLCGVTNFDIKDGIATTDKGIAYSTNRIDVVGSGVIDLKTEQMNIAVKPRTKGGIGISAGNIAELVKISGTLAEPKVAPDSVAAFKTAASVGAAVATGGVSLLAQGLFSKATADEDPCATALGVAPKKTTTTTQSETSTPAPKPDTEKNVGEKAVDTVKDAGKSITEGLKGLFD